MNLTVYILHAASWCLNFTHEVTLGEDVYLIPHDLKLDTK